MAEYGFGSGVLTGQRTDNASLVPIRFGALQDVSIEFNGDIKELFATQQFPIDTARGKIKIAGKAKVAEIRGRMYNDLFFGQTLTTGQVKYAYQESTTLGTGAASYTVLFATSTPLQDQGVFYIANGTQLIPVTSGPSSGQYTWVASTGIYSFSTFDAVQPIYVNYTYKVSTGFSIGLTNPLMGTTPQFKTTLFQQYEGNQIVLVLNACITSRLTIPTRIDDYIIADMDFSAFADAGGNIGSWNSAN